MIARTPVLLAALGAVGLLLLGASTPDRAVARNVSGWARRVIGRVSLDEGRPDSLNRNLDGAGLSFGILQWNQKTGNLGALLVFMREADPRSFAQIFGPSWPTLLDVARRGSLEAVDGVPLWEDPWTTRFVAAGRHPPFVEAQWRLAEHGAHFRGAVDVANALGVRTERAMALFFDRSVQQGPVAARKLAAELRARWSTQRRTVVPYGEALQAYAELAASRFRRTTPPPSPYYSDQARHIVWRPVGGEWHAVAGRWDLYETVARRTRAILADRRLADLALTEEAP